MPKIKKRELLKPSTSWSSYIIIQEIFGMLSFNIAFSIFSVPFIDILIFVAVVWRLKHWVYNVQFSTIKSILISRQDTRSSMRKTLALMSINYLEFSRSKYCNLVDTIIHIISICYEQLNFSYRALRRMNERMQPNDKIVHALFEVIMGFSSDRNSDELASLTALDLFCCLKHRRPQIEKGIDQLQELCVHFARIANQQCIS